MFPSKQQPLHQNMASPTAVIPLDLAEKEEIIITRHGKPAGILIGFGSEEDWFDYRLEHDPRFLARIASARESLKKGKGIRIENLPD